MSGAMTVQTSTAPVRAVLFDLDGTLLDTAEDLWHAANRMLEALRLPSRSLEEVRSFVGKGTAKLVERCIAGGGETLERALALFEAAYLEESGRHTQIYPGVLEGLEMLRADGIAMACVTNKPGKFTLPLLQTIGIAKYFPVVVSGDTLERRKPDPLPYAHACSQLGVEESQAVVVGDSANDMVAGRAAGCRVWCVPYGYREGQTLESLDCDAVVSDVVAAVQQIREINGVNSNRVNSNGVNPHGGKPGVVA